MAAKVSVYEVDISAVRFIYGYLTNRKQRTKINDHYSSWIDLIFGAPLRIRNLNKIVVGHLNINSIRNKFNFLAQQVKGNIDILMISETKLDKSFPPSQFFLDGCSVSFRFDRNGNGGGILLYIRDDLPSKRLSINKNIKGFFVEINLRNKKKWLLSCSYNPTKNANIKSSCRNE